MEVRRIILSLQIKATSHCHLSFSHSENSLYTFTAVIPSLSKKQELLSRFNLEASILRSILQYEIQFVLAQWLHVKTITVLAEL